MRRKGKVDANQSRVVEHLRKAGLSVFITSGVGNGFPDLVVSGNNWIYWCENKKRIGSKTILVELKDGSKPPSARKLTPDEKKFHDSWKGEIILALTAEDVLKHF